MTSNNAFDRETKRFLKKACATIQATRSTHAAGLAAARLFGEY